MAANEIFGKHHQKKKPWGTADFLDLCDKGREPRKKRFKHEGSENYKEENNAIKRCMKKAKENWIGEQCSKIEENLRKNNSKQQEGIPTRERLDHCETRKSYYRPRSFRKMPHRKMTG